jgi:hypothetical protein
MTWLTLDEVSRKLGFDSPAPLARLLSFFPGAFPGALKDEDHGWIVPSTTLSALQRPRVGIELPQEATVQEVAEAIRRSPKTIWRWCQPGPGGVLIDVRSVLALPAKLPDWLSDAVKQSRMVIDTEEVSSKAAAPAPLALPDRQQVQTIPAASLTRDSQCTGTTPEAHETMPPISAICYAIL